VLTPETPTWRRVAEAALWALVVVGALWLAVRLLGLERGFPLVPLVAYTPYVPIPGIVAVVVAAFLRRRAVAAVAAVLTLAFVALVLPRALPGQGDRPAGPHLTVLTANLKYGNGDPRDLVGLVRSSGVELLCIQELTPRARAELEEAGLDELLPHQALDPASRASGSAVYARFPLRNLELTVGEGGFAMPQAEMLVPGAPALDVMSVHPPPPMGSSEVADWGRDLSGLPRAEPTGRVRLLAGDFNATLDHAELRELVESGYADAADAVGVGLVFTWPRPVTSMPVTIDHVLVDERVYVEDVSVHDLAGSDHRMVLAELVLPPGPVETTRPGVAARR
jgi:endonuclease/exonuclease/phosphatase (EEP) superfamily protein YafD